MLDEINSYDNIPIILRDVVREKVSELDLSKQYLDKLIELYKITMILKSDISDNNDNFTYLSMLKTLEFNSLASDIKDKISSMNDDNVKNIVLLFEKEIEERITYYRKYSNDIKLIVMNENIKKALLSYDKNVIINLVKFQYKELFDDQSFEIGIFKQKLFELTPEFIKSIETLSVDEEFDKIAQTGIYNNRYDGSNMVNSVINNIKKLGFNSRLLGDCIEQIRDTQFKIANSLFKKKMIK